MSGQDRLYGLSTMRLVLRQHWFSTAEDVLTATPGHLKDLHRWRGEILRIVRAGYPQVLYLLFVPREVADWQVAGLESQPDVRALSARRGKEQILSTTYTVEDDGSSEREAWAQLVKALPAPVPA